MGEGLHEKIHRGYRRGDRGRVTVNVWQLMLYAKNSLLPVILLLARAAGAGLDQGSILVTVIVTLPTMDFHDQLFPMDIVSGNYFADEHRHAISAPGARVKSAGLIWPIIVVFH
jgi:hypothetical protein